MRMTPTKRRHCDSVLWLLKLSNIVKSIPFHYIFDINAELAEVTNCFARKKSIKILRIISEDASLNYAEIGNGKLLKVKGDCFTRS